MTEKAKPDKNDAQPTHPENCARPDAIQKADVVEVQHLVHRWRFLRRRIGHLHGYAIGDRRLNDLTWKNVPDLPPALATGLREAFKRRRDWRRSM